MRLGYGTYIGDPSVVDAEIDAVADAGFDAMLYSEHHGMRGYVPDPLAAGIYVLGRAPSLRAGPMPLVLPLHDPVAVAEAAALADAISGGRLRFGVAAGFLARDFDQRGLDVSSRGPRLEEATAIMRAIWRGEPGPFDGSHFSVPALDRLTQMPAQTGGPPVWMAVGTPAGIRRAARVADGIVIDSVRSQAGVTQLIEAFTTTRADVGLDRGTIAVMRRGWIGTSQEIATFVSTLQAELDRIATAAQGNSMPWFDQPGGGTSTDDVRSRALVGDPADVVAGLDELAALGVDYVVLKVQWTGGLEPARLLEQLGRWCGVCSTLNA